MKYKFFSILGSTGSVGVSSLKIIEKRKNIFKINLLSANKNYNLICHQIQKYKPSFFLIFDKKIFEKVKKKFKKKNVKIINSLDEKYFIKKSDITISEATHPKSIINKIIFKCNKFENKKNKVLNKNI